MLDKMVMLILQSTRQSLFTSVLMAVLIGITSCQQSRRLSIRAAHSTWIEEQFQTEVVNIGLERLGFQIEEPQVLDYPATYVAIANGELDFSVINYGVAHQGFFDNANRTQQLALVGVITPNGWGGYQIDQKTAVQHRITHIHQLQDPALAKLFDSDGDGKANLVGCNPGWACEATIDHHIREYGLQDTVEHDKGQYVALMADALTRYKQAQPILYFAYHPHWIAAVLKPGEDVLWLEVPYTSFPADQGEVTAQETTVAGKNVGFSRVEQRIVANKGFLAAHPRAKRWFDQVEIPAQDMNAESLRIQEGEDSPEQIRRHAQEWIEKNQAQFERWLAIAKAENRSRAPKP